MRSGGADAERTVEFHLTNIFQKLYVSSRVEAMLWFKAQNSPDPQIEVLHDAGSVTAVAYSGGGCAS